MAFGGIIGQTASNILGGVGGMFSAPKAPSSSNWMPYLQEAQQQWQDARTQAMQQVGAGQQATMEMFSPFLPQLQGMAQPYSQAGIAGLQGFQNLLQDPSSITSDPLYTGRLGAGQQAIENSAAARGMQLSGANLQDMGNFASSLAADTLGQRLNQFAQLGQMGQQGFFSGLSGLQGIAGINQAYDQMMMNANFGGISGAADVLGAMAQANSAAALGQMNAQAQQNAGLFGGLGQLGGMLGSASILAAGGM